MTLTIRRATPADASTVVEFNCRLAEESEGKTLDRSLLVPGVQAALTDPNKSIYFLAEKEEKVLGQLAITYEWSDWRNGWFWWIQSVYVRPEARRQGVFRSLFRHLQQAASDDATVIGIRLYVEEHNDRAQQTYLRMGLTPTGYFVQEKYPLDRQGG